MNHSIKYIICHDCGSHPLTYTRIPKCTSFEDPPIVLISGLFAYAQRSPAANVPESWYGHEGIAARDGHGVT